MEIKFWRFEFSRLQFTVFSEMNLVILGQWWLEIVRFLLVSVSVIEICGTIGAGSVRLMKYKFDFRLIHLPNFPGQKGENQPYNLKNPSYFGAIHPKINFFQQLLDLFFNFNYPRIVLLVIGSVRFLINQFRLASVNQTFGRLFG